MKTKNSSKQIKTVQQDSGCCDSSKAKVQPVQNPCCSSTSQVQETPRTSVKCC